MRFLCVLASSAAVAVLAAERPSEACTAALPEIEELPDGELTNVPVAGVVPIYINGRPLYGYDEPITMTVVDDAGTPVAGTLEILVEARLVWRSQQPLIEATRYTAMVEGNDIRAATFTFVTESAPSDRGLALQGSASLVEVERTDTQVCCRTNAFDSCLQHYVDQCWTQTYAYVPRLEITTDREEAMRYWFFEILSETASHAATGLNGRGSQSDALFPEAGAPYCATVRATSLLDGEIIEREYCLGDDDLIPLAEQSEPETPTPEVCAEPLSGGEPGGCAAGSATASFPLVLLAIVALRRRTRH